MPIPQCINRCVPRPVGVSVNQTVLVLGNTAATITAYTDAGVFGPSPRISVPNTMLQGFAPQVFVNGVLQRLGTEYTVDFDAGEVSFASHVTMNNDTVTVVYATSGE